MAAAKSTMSPLVERQLFLKLIILENVLINNLKFKCERNSISEKKLEFYAVTFFYLILFLFFWL